MKKGRSIAWDERAGASANARRILPGLAAEYFAEVRKTLAGNLTLSGWHPVRLATKRLRYTLELFQTCYGPGLDARLDGLRRLQQLLGDLNDCVVALDLLPNSMSARKFIERRAVSKAREFRKEWAEVFDAPSQESAWMRYLSGGSLKAIPAARRAG